MFHACQRYVATAMNYNTVTHLYGDVAFCVDAPIVTQVTFHLPILNSYLSLHENKSRRASLSNWFLYQNLSQHLPRVCWTTCALLCFPPSRHPDKNWVLRFGSFCQLLKEGLIHFFLLVLWPTAGTHYEVPLLFSQLSFTQKLSIGLPSTSYCTSEHMYISFIYRATTPFSTYPSFHNSTPMMWTISPHLHNPNCTIIPQLY